MRRKPEEEFELEMFGESEIIISKPFGERRMAKRNKKGLNVCGWICPQRAQPAQWIQWQWLMLNLNGRKWVERNIKTYSVFETNESAVGLTLILNRPNEREINIAWGNKNLVDYFLCETKRMINRHCCDDEQIGLFAMWNREWTLTWMACVADGFSGEFRRCVCGTVLVGCRPVNGR